MPTNWKLENPAQVLALSMCQSAQMGFHTHSIWVFHFSILYGESSQAFSDGPGIQTEPHMKTIQSATRPQTSEKCIKLSSNDFTTILQRKTASCLQSGAVLSLAVQSRILIHLDKH